MRILEKFGNRVNFSDYASLSQNIPRQPSMSRLHMTQNINKSYSNTLRRPVSQAKVASFFHVFLPATLVLLLPALQKTAQK